MKKQLKRILGLCLAVTICFSMTVTALASEVSETENTDSGEIKGEVTTDEGNSEDSTDKDDDNVVVEKDDKPYLALGADLTAEQ